jgi:uroporphyrinogen decarboxylase
MTPRRGFLTALDGGWSPGRVPHFELVFYLTMEAFGRVHPTHRSFAQWDQMSATERDLHRRDIADLYVKTAERYEHSAILFHRPGGWGKDNFDDPIRTLEHVREISGEQYALLDHGDVTYGIPSGDRMAQFIEDLADRPQRLKDHARREVDWALARAEKFRSAGVLDGFVLACDYCFNDGPFMSPAMLDEFVMPYLAELIAAYRRMGFYTIKHTDGNIMPILDALVAAGPHALHSLDPQGGVDLAEVKRRVGSKVCLIGNVNCGLLDTGTDEQVVESARYALRNGMPGGGYVFSTSNCVYTGMALRRYELVLDVWRSEGNYPG